MRFKQVRVNILRQQHTILGLIFDKRKLCEQTTKIEVSAKAKEKDPVTDPETIASFKHGIKKLLEDLEPGTREQMISELAEWADSPDDDATA